MPPYRIAPYPIEADHNDTITGTAGILRANSTVLTGGLGNPAIAAAELGGVVLISFLALAAPAAAIALVMLFLLVAMRLARGLFRGAKSSGGRT